jgi:hypothetical protein
MINIPAISSYWKMSVIGNADVAKKSDACLNMPSKNKPKGFT